MTKIKKPLTNFIDLTEEEKDYVLDYIRIKEVSIKNAAHTLNMTVATVNRIFSERFGKREGCSETRRKEYYKKYWQKNKFK
tara:strand:- start:480 stop:722 length:243 start_codon:yes stop_codon:yes gene_type:complete